MKTRRIAILVTAAVITGGAFAATKQHLTVKSASAHSDAQPIPSAPAKAFSENNSVEKESDVPKHIAYGLFFGEMIVLKKKAQERESQGIKSDAMRDYHKDRASLNPYQSQMLDQIASEANDKVIKINDKARRLIDRERARHPHGKLKDGEPLPVPPPELFELEEVRKQTLLGAREQLRTALGEKDFERIDDFIQQDIEARTKASPRPKQ